LTLGIWRHVSQLEQDLEDAMKIPRRQFLCLAAGAAALPHSAQAYPTRPVRAIVGLPAGSTGDIFTRLIAQWLSERLGQPFVTENRPGAATNIAAEVVARAPPDGYTLLFVTLNNAINATLYDNLSFNFIRDIASVASISRNPFVMEVNPSVPAKTVPELIAYLKANPGKLSFGSSGNGSASHVAAELFKMMAAVNLHHVPYRGDAPAITDLLAGRVQVFFSVMASSIEHIKAGRLRALAVTTSTRSEALPEIPTLGEFVPGYEVHGWNGIGAPAKTPAEIIDRLNRDINAALDDPKIKARVASLGGTVLAGSPTDFGNLIVEETEKWAKVIKSAGIKPE
jgi:tripartite-type tricarboxylate transporter receptor subunit TctC